MRILITNDDGVNSSGIMAAKKAVEDLGTIDVVAPATQQSGIGHALTLFEPIRSQQQIFQIRVKHFQFLELQLMQLL